MLIFHCSNFCPRNVITPLFKNLYKRTKKIQLVKPSCFKFHVQFRLYNDSPVRNTVVTNDRWGIGTSCRHGDFLTCKDRYNPGKNLVLQT